MPSLPASLPATWTREGRNAGRALVRSASGFDAWCLANPNVDRNALIKMDIVKAAKDLGIYDALVGVVLAHEALGAATSADVVEEAAEKAAANLAEDARIDAKLAAADARQVEIDANTPPAAVTLAAIDAAIGSVLDPVRQYVHPSLLDGLAARIRPLAEAANKPAATVVKVVEVEVPAPLVAPPGALPFAKIVGSDTMGKVFALKAPQAKMPVAIWDAADALTPDPAYQVDVPTMTAAVTAWEHGETLWLVGPMGSGKGTLCREYAARTGRPFVRIGFERSTEVVDLRGQSEPVPGETHGAQMVWVDKVFTASVRRPGTFVLLDEITTAPAGTVAWYQTVLDERQITLPTGEVVHFAPGVIVAIADNTAGYGDPTGAYAGTAPANAALIDRCSRMVYVDYLPPAKEALALHKRTGIPFPAAERLAKFAAKVRADQAKAGGESRAFSYRRIVAFALATFRDRIDAPTAWETTAFSRLPDADREALRQAVRIDFKADDYLAEMNGATVPAASTAPVSQAAEQVNARDVFARS